MTSQEKDPKRTKWQAPPNHWRKVKHLARDMRKNPTAAEQKLWKYLRKRQVCDVKFRRQMAIDRYIVDFCSPSIKLIIEIDGPTHEDCEEEDALRQKKLESYGFDFLRFKNQTVLFNLEGVLEVIYETVRKKTQRSGQYPQKVRR
jgi:very-short-patch-repair endonuclease